MGRAGFEVVAGHEVRAPASLRPVAPPSAWSSSRPVDRLGLHRRVA